MVVDKRATKKPWPTSYSWPAWASLATDHCLVTPSSGHRTQYVYIYLSVSCSSLSVVPCKWSSQEPPRVVGLREIRILQKSTELLICLVLISISRAPPAWLCRRLARPTWSACLMTPTGAPLSWPRKMRLQNSNGRSVGPRLPGSLAGFNLHEVHTNFRWILTNITCQLLHILLLCQTRGLSI